MLSSSHVLWLLLTVYLEAGQRVPIDLDLTLPLDLSAES